MRQVLTVLGNKTVVKFRQFFLSSCWVDTAFYSPRFRKFQRIERVQRVVKITSRKDKSKYTKNLGNKFSQFLIIYNLFFESSRTHTSVLRKSYTRKNTAMFFPFSAIRKMESVLLRFSGRCKPVCFAVTVLKLS